jgi:hypothetical protein
MGLGLKRRWVITHKKLIFLIFVILLLAVGTTQAAEFRASEGFSDTQGANGWSYAAVHFPGVDDLAANQVLGTYDSQNNRWEITIPGVSTVYIDANSQCMTEGNAVFSLRYWTADQDYDLVVVNSTLYATVTLGARLVMVDANTSTTTDLTNTFWAITPPQTINICKTLTEVKQGDRIYFLLQNSGDGQGSLVMQVWDPVITANVENPSGKTYYIDSVDGNDNNSGLSSDDAWASLNNVNSTCFQPGDRILFKAGTSYTGCLNLQGCGIEGFPIVVDMYGDGSKPCIDSEGLSHQTVLLSNVEYWEVNNLELVGGDELGVYVYANNCGTTHHIYLRNLYIHDVFGNNNSDTGGILCENKGTTVVTVFDDLLIENCHLVRTDRNGILVSGWVYHNRTNWHPNLNVVIRGNLLEDIGGDGVFVISCDGCLIEHNVVRYAQQRATDRACAGIWPMSCDNTVIQFNEVSHTAVGGAPVWDSEGFDSDTNCRNTVFQYNYSHDNAGGFLLVCSSEPSEDNLVNTGTVARYNISQNDRIATFSIEGPVEDVCIYNNDIYVGSGMGVHMTRNTFGSPNNIRYYNNILYADGTMNYSYFGSITNIIFENNVFYGNHNGPPYDPNAITADPKLVAPGSGGDGRDSLEGYKLQETSPCIDAGRDPNVDPNDYANGGRDFWCNMLPRPLNGNVDIGAHESNCLAADLNSDGAVDFDDFAILISYWLTDEPSVDIAPVCGDSIINFLDYAFLADEL